MTLYINSGHRGVHKEKQDLLMTLYINSVHRGVHSFFPDSDSDEDITDEGEPFASH